MEKTNINDPFPENPSGIPGLVSLQINNKCNSRCIMCAHKDTHGKYSYSKISMENFTRIIDQFVDLGVKRFALSLQCEPLLDNEIYKKIIYIKNKNASSGISTNGLLLDDETMQKLCDSGINYIGISLNALTEKTFKYVYGISADFQKLIKNITNALINKPDNVRMTVNVMLVKENFWEFTSKNHEIFDIIKERNIKLAVGPISNHCGSLPNYFNLLIDQEHQSSTKKLYCHDIFEAVYILYDGDIIGCCSDFRKKFIVGNINKQNFIDIWNSDLNKQRRHDMMYRNLYEIEPCKECSQAWNIMKNRGVESA